jgi:nucleotide sugar dehydrogenase
MYLLSKQEIEAGVDRREARIACIGLGRVGLPLAAVLADQGFRVSGIDINEGLVAGLNHGQSSFPDEKGLDELLQKVVASDHLKATTRIEAVKECDLIIIAVPTLIEGETPDVRAVEIVANGLADGFSPGKVVLLQSTVPPYSTQNLLGKIIEGKTGFKPGTDFGLAYSPERTQAPQVLQDLKTYPKIVAGIDEKSTLMVSRIYSTFAPSIMEMDSIVAAEIEKVVENTYRDVNIAFANELARLCELYGIDVTQIIGTANSQPYCHILNPGLVGGHCIPMDPYYIISDARQRGVVPELIKTARETNEAMFHHVADMIVEGVRKITILGLSFKENVRSFDTSHTLKLVNLLIEKGYDVTVHDPFLNDDSFDFKTEPDLYRAIEGRACIILSTAHSAYQNIDLSKIKRLMRGNLIIDVRAMFQPQQVLRAGLKYKGIGRVK